MTAPTIYIQAIHSSVLSATLRKIRERKKKAKMSPLTNEELDNLERLEKAANLITPNVIGCTYDETQWPVFRFRDLLTASTVEPHKIAYYLEMLVNAAPAMIAELRQLCQENTELRAEVAELKEQIRKQQVNLKFLGLA